MSKHDDWALKREPAPWRRVIFVCSKCMKRQDRESLRGDLRSELKSRGHKDIRVVACGCLDLCPKRGVTMLFGEQPGALEPTLFVIESEDRIDRIVDVISKD